MALTLSKFSQVAADEIDARDTTNGYARYAVVWKETKPLLAIVNKSLGTHYPFITLRSC